MRQNQSARSIEAAPDRELTVLILPKYTRRAASSRLRCYQYLPLLGRFGIRAKVVPLLDDEYIVALYSGVRTPITTIVHGYLKRLDACWSAGGADLVWIERDLLPWVPAFAEGFLTRRWRVPYVVDIDDAVFHGYDRHNNWLVRRILGNKIDRLMAGSSAVFAGNRYLAERAAAAGAKQVIDLPTVVDLDKYALAANRSDVLTIGWIGTPITAKYLEGAFHEALASLTRKCHFRMVIVGANHPGWTDVPVETAPWDERSERDVVAGFDIGVMPLCDGPFERGKCGYKLIQYLSAGVPVVASPVGVNCEIVKPGVNGFLAGSAEEWITALELLCGSSELRSQMRSRCRNSVLQFGLRENARKLAERLWNIAGHERAPQCYVELHQGN